MAKSRKAKRVQRIELRKSISWAAKYHEQYVLVDDGKVYYCLAYMKSGKAALILYTAAGMGVVSGKQRLTCHWHLATDGDLAIARLDGSLFQDLDHIGNASLPEPGMSCRALDRKVKFWRERKWN